jgi:hypothetical protein
MLSGGARSRPFSAPWPRSVSHLLTLTTPHETAELLAAAGFRVLEDLGPQDVAARFGLSCLSPERIVLAQKTA